MKILRDRVIVFSILIVFLFTSGIYAAYKVKASNGDTEAGGINEEEAAVKSKVTFGPEDIRLVNKDETVYVNLNHDGSVSKINVVNYWKAQEAGIYKDFGQYENIINLTNNVNPIKTEDEISWELIDSNGEFYYQGQLKSGEVPWTFDIEYQLNQEVTEGKDLAGASGELTITINVKENEKAEEYFRKNYMMQITVPLNMQNSTLISAPSAVQMIAGHTKTLAFTVLPQTSATFEIKASVTDFFMEAMDIAIMKADLSSYMDVDEISEGFQTMSEGMDGLVEGTVQLKEGMDELSGGIGSLTDGLKEVTLGTPKLTEGMKEFNDGLVAFEEGLDELSEGSSKMKEGLQSLNGNGGQLLTGYQEMETGLATILSMKEQLTLIAQEMSKSTDPQTVMLSQTIFGQLQGLTELQTGLKTLNTNLEQYLQGVSTASGQYDALDTGIHELPNGFGQLADGYQEIKDGNEAVYSAIDEINQGLSEVNTASAQIPDQVQQLADGQTDMKEGVDQAAKEIKELTQSASDKEKDQPVSFAAPGKIIPNSVQFVLRTAAIEKAVEPVGIVETQVEEEGFWDKLIGLFK